MASLPDVMLVMTPALNLGKKMSSGDEDIEDVIVHEKHGPMIYNMMGRMVPYRTASPGVQENSWMFGGAPVRLRDKAAGQLTNSYHQWQNKTNTQMKVDLLTVAKKNKKFRELQGEDFCKRQEFDFLVKAMPQRKLRAKSEGDELRLGDTAECELQEGDFTGSRVICRLVSAGSEAGLFNVRLPPQPPIIAMAMDAPDVPTNILYKMKVTCWRVTYKLGMDIRESKENEGPIKNNQLRTRPTLNVGQAVRIVQEVVENGITFLRLEDGRGWIFDQKPGVGVACVRDEASIDNADGIECKLPDDEDGVTDLEVLGRRLRNVDSEATVIGLQKVKPAERDIMLAQLSEAKHMELLDHLRAQIALQPLTQYLLENAKNFGAGQIKKVFSGFGEH